MPGTGDSDIVTRDAAEWLASTTAGSFRPTVPTLRERFGLTAQEAVAAIRIANTLRNARAT